MKNLHTGGNFETMGQKNYTCRLSIKNKYVLGIIISKNSTKYVIVKNRSSKPFIFAGNFANLKSKNI